MTPITNIDDPRYVKALSHPLRVRILAMLQEREASPVELAEWLGARLGTVAYHVRALHQIDLIELVGETQVRGAVAHHYRAKERPRVSDEAWGEAAPVAKQAAIGAALQTIDEYARASAASGGFDRPDAHLTRTSLRLDGEGWDQVAKACLELLERVQRIEAATAERIAQGAGDEEVVDAGLVVLLFEAVQLSGRPSPARDGSEARSAAHDEERSTPA
jgi:DNA-binding transcriptional ArsR family regulator